jgi:hypothetical protein
LQKKTFFKGEDVSPVPLKEFYSALETIPALVEFGRKYQLSFSQIAKTAGFGFRVLGSLNKKVQNLNLKIKYLLFSFSIVDAPSFVSSFKNIIFCKDSIFITGFTLWVISWIERTRETLIDEAGWLTEFFPSKFVKTYGYILKVYELVYLSYLDKALTSRVTMLRKLDAMSLELTNFVKIDLAYYKRKGLPLQAEPILIPEVSNLVWSLMKLNKESIRLPITMLSFHKQKDLAAAFTKGKGVPSLFHQHQVFKELLHSKEAPRFMEAGFPFRALPTILRRLSSNRKFQFIGSLLMKRFSHTIKFLSFLSIASSLGAIIVGPGTIVAILSTVYTFISAMSSVVDSQSWFDPCGIIMRIIILLLISSGLLFITRSNTLGPQLVDLYQHFEGDWYDVGYRLSDIIYHEAMILLDLATPIVWNTVNHSMSAGILFGFIVSSFSVWILRWILGW